MNELIRSVGENQIVCFKAGAGSGKTSQLIELLCHLLKEHEVDYLKCGKRIAAITYTNTAVDEIKNRLPRNNIISVSTIHEFLWSFIRPFSNEIRARFYELLSEEIDEKQNKVDDPKFAVLKGDADLTKDITGNADFEKELYKAKLKDEIQASTFFRPYLIKYEGIKPTLFRSYCISFKQLARLRKAKIDLDNDQGKKVMYDPNTNVNRFSSFTFSHDALLDISKHVFEKNKIAQRIFRDKYPYVLIDEYQDTNLNVILALRATIGENGFPKLVFFGDPFQKIYEDGITTDLKGYFQGPSFQLIKEERNFRSAPAIIDCANSFRTNALIGGQGEITQTPGSENIHKDGDVIVYICANNTDKSIKQWIDSVEQSLSTDYGPLHVFLTKNTLIAREEGFPNLFNVLQQSPYGKNKGADFTNQTINYDEKKLGEVQFSLVTLSKIFDFLVANKPLSFLIRTKQSSVLTWSEFKHGVQELSNRLSGLAYSSTTTIGDYVRALDQLKTNPIIKPTLKEAASAIDCRDNIFNADDYINHFSSKLIDDPDISAENVNQSYFFDIPFSELINYYKYLFNPKEKPIYYQTWHSAKGREYDKVALVMTDDFGKDKEYFSKLFTGTHSPDDEKFKISRNLLYVGLTRAKKHLRILYVPSMSVTPSLKQNFEDMMGIKVDDKLCITDKEED